VDPSHGLFETDFARSLQRSRARRAAKAARREARRRRFTRIPVPTVAVVLALSVAGVGGLGAATASSGALTPGSSGPAVKTLQRALGVSPATGFYGPLTKRAVRRFQRKVGLTADGVAGPRTLSALGIAGVAPRTRTRSPGSRSGRLWALLRRIAMCESGGNPRAIGGGGRYRGKYQFTRATWRAFGGRGDPAKAPEAVQDRIAMKVLRTVGRRAWPHCAR
jgi:hypothetical protein